MNADSRRARRSPSPALRPLLTAAVAALLALCAAPAAAVDGAPGECAAEILPPQPPPGTPPAIHAWTGKSVPAATLARCAGWDDWRPRVAVALAGDLRIDGGTDALLARIGAIGTLGGIKYWSTDARGWEELVAVAAALDGPDAEARRPDFSADELRDGETRYFVQYDNRSTGGVIFRMRAAVLDEDRIVLAVENASAVGFLFVSAFEPRDLRSVHVLRRLAPDRWAYFGIYGAREGTFDVLDRASAINRAVAYYRHIAGVPTDRDPPAAPD